jgi:hypothetical protein
VFQISKCVLALMCRCVDDEKQRFTAKQLREHPFLKNFIATPLDAPRDQAVALHAAKGDVLFTLLNFFRMDQSVLLICDDDEMMRSNCWCY